MIPNNYGIWINADTGETCVIFAHESMFDHDVRAYVLDGDYCVLPHPTRPDGMVGVAHTVDDAVRHIGIADGDWKHLAPPTGSTRAHMTEKDHDPADLLERLLDSIDRYQEPDPSDTTRQWNSDYHAYHRGCVLFEGGVTPEDWELLRPHFERKFRKVHP